MPASGPPVSVLVAAEGPAAAEVHRALLRRLGATVSLFAGGGPAALEAAASDHEAVLVGLPGAAGIRAAETAAALGKALYLDAPSPAGRGALDELVGSAAALGLVVEIGWRFRLHPTFRLLASLAAGERDGPVRGLAVRVSARPGDAAADTLLGEGLALARGLLGAPSGVSALQAAGGTRRVAMLAWPGDVLGTVEVDAASPVAGMAAELSRRDAVYRWHLGDGRLVRADARGEVPVADPPLGWEADSLLPQHLAHWLARVAEPARRAAVPLEDALDVADLLAAVAEAAAGGPRVRLASAA